LSGAGVEKKRSVVIDSTLSFEEAVAGSAAPAGVLATLRLVDVPYIGFDGLQHRGQIVVHRDIADEMLDIFRTLVDLPFPIAGARPIVRYGWSDEASMSDNNTNAFHYRLVAGTSQLSRHALGLAIDINPFFNPLVYPDGSTIPPGAFYRPDAPGVITEGGSVLREFLRRGWRWGGHFNAYRDHHHFEKPLENGAS